MTLNNSFTELGAEVCTESGVALDPAKKSHRSVFCVAHRVTRCPAKGGHVPLFGVVSSVR